MDWSWLGDIGKEVAKGAIPAVIGGVINSNAQGKALDAQTQAGDKALALQKEMYDQSRQDLAPYRDSGNAANAKLSSLMGLAMPFDGAAYRTKLLTDHPMLFGGQAPAANVSPAGYGSADEQLMERLNMYAGEQGTGGAPSVNAQAARRLLTEYNRVKDIPDGEVNKFTGEPFNKAEYLAGIQKQLENMAMGKNEGLFGQAAREETQAGRDQRDKVYSSTYVPSKSKQSFLGKYGAPIALAAMTGGIGALAPATALAGAGSTALSGANIAKNALGFSSYIGRK